MAFGESTVFEELESYQRSLAESEGVLGAKVFYLGQADATVNKDRLGGVKSVTAPAPLVEVQGGAVVFEPAKELLLKSGIVQEPVDVLFTISTGRLPKNFDRKNGRFIIESTSRNRGEYTIVKVAEIGQVGNTFTHLAIGLLAR